MVGVEGIEPTPPKWPDFESGASTSSAILPVYFSDFYLVLYIKSISLFETIEFEKRRKSVAIILVNLSKKFYDNHNYPTAKKGDYWDSDEKLAYRPTGLVVRPITNPLLLPIL